MRIVQANLCLRFYRNSGWIRESVRQLLKQDARLARVVPRYFDRQRDPRTPGFELDDGLPHDECDYFAVYGSCEPFDAKLLARHEIV